MILHDCYNFTISIHAPARGATAPFYFCLNVSRISIHAPARGATTNHNSRTPHSVISIHAPARGATSCTISATSAKTISIHAPARGATTHTTNHCFVAHKFQSTLPRGERPDFVIGVFGVRNFNPRSREGSDDKHSFHSFLIKKDFNPRSREGSDISTPKFKHVPIISIHAPARGATRLASCPFCTF